MRLFDLPPWLWYSIGTIAVAILGGVATAFRSYRKSLSKDSERFASYILGTLRLVLGRHVSSALANQLGIRRYAEKCLGTFPTHLIIPSVDNARISIDSAYVHLSLSGTAVQRVSDESLLTGELGSVLIFGEPGSGKSSLTKKIYRRSCAQAYATPASSRLPIHLELRRCDWAGLDEKSGTTSGEWLYQQLLRRAADVEGIHDPSFVVLSAAKKGGLIVLLDGLDEIPENRMRLATDAIIDVTKRLRGMSDETMVITTARTQLRGGLARNFQESMEAVYSLEPFTPSDIFEFLRKWPYGEDSLGQAQRIFSTIHEHRTLAEMCTNPLILSMYVAQDQRYTNSENLDSVRLPDTRAEFYSSVIGELLLHRRAQQLGKGHGGSDSRRQREELLGNIALDHLYRSDDPANSISWTKAVATTRSVIGLGSDEKAEIYLRALSLDTGIFAEERIGESLRFMHLTLCEYLAAKEMTESKSPSISMMITSALGGADTNPGTRLWEVVVFAVSLLKRTDRLDALSELAAQQVPPELIMRIVRECQAYASPIFLDCVDAVVNQLVGVEVALWDDSWFDKVRALIVCLNDPAYRRQAAGAQTHLTIPWLFSKLTGSDDVRMTTLFDIWLRTNPAEAMSFTDTLNLDSGFWATGSAIDALEQPEFTAYAMSRLVDSPSHREIWASLLAEAGLKNNLVAETLAGEPAGRLPSTGRDPGPWAREGAAARTIYGNALDMATENLMRVHPPGDQKILPRVALLSTITPSMATLGMATGRSSPFVARVALFLNLFAILFLVASITIGGEPALLLLAVTILTSSMGSGGWLIFSAGSSSMLKRGTSERRPVGSTEMARAMLNLGLFRLPPLPSHIRYAVASVHGRTIAYTRYGVDTALPEGLAKELLLGHVHPVPVEVTVDDAAMIDLRGLHRGEAAAYLLGGAFPFVDASDLDIPAPPRSRLAGLARLVIIILPKSPHRPLLLPSY